MLFSLVGLSDMVFFIGELSVRIGPCDMVFSIIGDFGMVFSIVGLSVTDSPSWTPPLWMIFALAGSSGMAFSIEVRPTQTPAGNVCLFWFVARSYQARTIDWQCQSLSLRRAFLLRSVCLSCMSVSVSRSLAYVEQGRSTCNVNRYLSVELFCFAACACHCT